MAEGGAADLETQRSDVAALLKTALRKGDTWYLVDSRWFKQWKKYVGFDSWDKYQMGDQNVYPGPIDNSGLLKDGDSQSLKEHLIDELDYILLPTEGWNKLVSWYTLMEGQEPIARKVVEQGMFVKHCKVEVYLTELKLCENGNMNNVVTRRFSKADTIAATVSRPVPASPSQRLAQIRRRKSRTRTRDEMFAEHMGCSQAEAAQQSQWRENLSQYQRSHSEQEDWWRQEDQQATQTLLGLMREQMDMLRRLVDVLQDCRQEDRAPLHCICNCPPPPQSPKPPSPKVTRRRGDRGRENCHCTPAECSSTRKLSFPKC
ncbi:ubiquitin carboxyl-terminal hydrolase 15 isoform 5-T11 [Pangshura tecta]